MDNRAQIQAKDRAVKAAGGGAALARALGLRSRQAVYMWDRVPAAHVLKVEALSKVPRHKLRPDLYPDPAAEARQ
jgi:DNA-binding transcriptional regulator YdaS (Cro superfamily)